MLKSTMDFFQFFPLPMWVLEVGTNRFLDVNNAALEFYGYSKEEFLNLDLDVIDEGEVRTELGKPVKLHRKKTGEIVYAHPLVQSVQFRMHVAQLVILSDFTASIEIERRTKEITERLNIVSKATSDTIWDLSLAKKQIVWNRGIKGVFGHSDISSNTTTYNWWLENIHPEDKERVIATMECHISQKMDRWSNEYRFKCGDGTYRYVLDRGFLVFDEVGEPVRMIGAIDDITERKVYIKAIEDQNKKFNEIAWIQSHMVRAPLARIMALVDLMKIEPDDTDCEEILSYLSSSAKELDAVIINMAHENKSQLN